MTVPARLTLNKHKLQIRVNKNAPNVNSEGKKFLLLALEPCPQQIWNLLMLLCQLVHKFTKFTLGKSALCGMM
jgi:hypothetical protein